MKYDFDFNVRQKSRLRLILSTDAKNEADDQYAIAHAVMSPKLITKGIIASHFEYKRPQGSMEKSYEEIVKVLSLMDIQDDIKVLKGAEGALKDENVPIHSEGAAFIVEEAMKQDDLPLFVVCIGALTDLACAYLIQPEIAKKITAIWVGGGSYPKGHPEFNLKNDLNAANVVFKSEIPLWQVPLDTCSTMKISLAELQYKVKPFGKIGEYLFEQLCEISSNEEWTLGESWIFWDSSAIGLLLDEHGFQFEIKQASSFNKDMNYIPAPGKRDIRVYNYIDTRFIFEDFFSKLAINYGK